MNHPDAGNKVLHMGRFVRGAVVRDDDLIGNLPAVLLDALQACPCVVELVVYRDHDGYRRFLAAGHLQPVFFPVFLRFRRDRYPAFRKCGDRPGPVNQMNCFFDDLPAAAALGQNRSEGASQAGSHFPGMGVQYCLQLFIQVPDFSVADVYFLTKLSDRPFCGFRIQIRPDYPFPEPRPALRSHIFILKMPCPRLERTDVRRFDAEVRKSFGFLQDPVQFRESGICSFN